MTSQSPTPQQRLMQQTDLTDDDLFDSFFLNESYSPLPPIHSLLATAEWEPSPFTAFIPQHSNQQTRQPPRSPPEFIDLTNDSPPLAPTVAPRHRHDSAEPARKRRRLAESRGPSGEASQPVSFEVVETSTVPVAPHPTQQGNRIEEVDLTHVHSDLDLKRHQAEQRRRHMEMEEQQNQLLKESVAAQQSPADGGFQLSKLSCIICMENITNMTATHCGHIFCHECIMMALLSGERSGHEPGKGLSRCPVCRKKVTRFQGKGKDPHQVIPLEFKFVRRSAKSMGKQREPVLKRRHSEVQEVL